MMHKLDEKKYKNVILYLIQKAGSAGLEGKKKIYKLLYYIDFDSYERYEKPITGDVYHKLQMGPAPNYFDVIANEMAQNGLLDIGTKKTGFGLNDTVIYKTKGRPDLKVFTKKELEILDRVCRLYMPKTGRQLENLTHKEAPYLAVNDGEEIPLELSFYRGTAFK